MQNRVLKETDTKLIEDIYYDIVIDSKYDFETEKFSKASKDFYSFCHTLPEDLMHNFDNIVSAYVYDGLSNGFVMGIKYATALAICASATNS